MCLVLLAGPWSDLIVVWWLCYYEQYHHWGHFCPSFLCTYMLFRSERCGPGVLWTHHWHWLHQEQHLQWHGVIQCQVFALHEWSSKSLIFLFCHVMLCHVDLPSNTLDVWVCRDRWDDVVDESVCLFICLMSVLCSATRSMFFTVTFLADVSLSLPVFLSVSVSLSLSFTHTHTHTGQ